MQVTTPQAQHCCPTVQCFGVYSYSDRMLKMTVLDTVCVGIIVCNLVVMCVAAMVLCEGGAPETNDVFSEKTWAGSDMTTSAMNVINIDELAPPELMVMSKNTKLE